MAFITYLIYALLILNCQHVIWGNDLPTAAENYWNHKLVNIPMPQRLRELQVTDTREFHYLHVDGIYKQGGNFKYALPAETKVVIDPKKNITSYFLLHDLFHSQMKLRLPKSSPTNLARILPRDVAHSLPFSSKNLTQILRMFSVSTDSSEARWIQNVLESCETRLSIEHRKCVTSLEDMGDFALTHAGMKDMRVYQNNVTVEGEAEEFVIGRVKLVASKVAFCHKEVFPYSVFYCHALRGTMAFEASISALQKGLKGGKVMVACHADTSTWDPRHLAFQVLKIKPGEATVCHTIDDNAIMWAASA